MDNFFPMQRRRLIAATLTGLAAPALAGMPAQERQIPQPPAAPAPTPAPFAGGRAVIVHGWGAGPADHWFGWLAGQLQAAGVPTRIPALPDSQRPRLEQWLAALDEAAGAPDERTLLIAHSLGTITTLHWLSQRRPARIGGLVLAAGFDRRLPRLRTIGGWPLDPYIDAAQVDEPAIARMAAGRLHHIIGSDDGVVPPAQSRALAARLGGRVHEVPGGGHLLASQGFARLPAAWAACQAALQTWPPPLPSPPPDASS